MVTQLGIQEILNHEDIEGLLVLGAPANEYEREAELIGRTVRAQASSESPSPMSKEVLKEIVRRIWSESFGPFSDEDLAKRESAFERVATKISALDAAE